MGSMSRQQRLVRSIAVAAALLALPGAALAQPSAQTPGDQPIVTAAETPEFAQARAKYEQMTPSDLAKAGYRIDAMCIASPMGAMGYHAVNPAVMQQQFPAGKLDPLTPSVVLVDRNQRVAGIEWEAIQSVPAPVLFGQKLVVQQGHPGQTDPHYMFHAYFRPNGQVYFGAWDPRGSCPPPGTARDGTSLAGESSSTQALFAAVWGANAAERWAMEHNGELTALGR